MSQIQRVLKSLLHQPMLEIERAIPDFPGRQHLESKARDGLQVIGDLASGAKARIAGGKAAAREAEADSDPTDEREREAFGLTLVRAMIAAARSDGSFDAEEKKIIYSAVREHDLSMEDQKLLQAELKQPISLESLVAAAKTSRMADQIYIASVLAIVVDTHEERAWLDKLAKALRLDPRLVKRIHQDLGVDA